MERSCTSAKLTTRISSKIINPDLCQTNFCEYGWASVLRRFCYLINFVYEYAHPLIASTMCVDRPALLARRLYLDAMFSSFLTIVRVLASYDQVGVPVVPSILAQGS